jgi:hypothetical protein
MDLLVDHRDACFVAQAVVGELGAFRVHVDRVAVDRALGHAAVQDRGAVRQGLAVRRAVGDMRLGGGGQLALRFPRTRQRSLQRVRKVDVSCRCERRLSAVSLKRR